MPAANKQVLINRVIDGDTVLVTLGRKPWLFFLGPKKDRIRLYGIDAPESSQKGGTESTKYLRKIIGKTRKIALEPVATDQYGRTVGLIYDPTKSRENSYNYQMVKAGQAHCYMVGAQDKNRYQEAEISARLNGHGLWKEKTPEKPWDYRKKEKSKGGSLFSTVVFAILILVALAAAGAAFLKYTS